MKVFTISELKEAMKYASFTLYITRPDGQIQVTPTDLVEFLDNQQAKLVVLATVIADKLAKGELK